MTLFGTTISFCLVWAVIGLCLTRGPSSFFRRVGAVPSTIIISQNDAATTKDLWKRSLSLSLEASSWRKLGHFIEDKATSSGLKFTQASIPPSSGFFSFSAENPTKTPTLNQSTLSLSRFIAWLIFRDGFISLKIFATRHCSTIELIPGNGRDFFFNLATPRFEYWIDLRLFYRLDPVASIYRSVIDPSDEFV